jgi:hypothetical protein
MTMMVRICLLIVLPGALGFVPRWSPVSRVARAVASRAEVVDDDDGQARDASGRAYNTVTGAGTECLPRTGDEVARIHADADAIFAMIDLNGDGAISEEEFYDHMTDCGYTEEAVSSLFKTLDLNANGLICKEELRNGLVTYEQLRKAPGLGNYNAQFVDEISADADAVFDVIDVDRSGGITDLELREYLLERDFEDAAVGCGASPMRGALLTALSPPRPGFALRRWTRSSTHSTSTRAARSTARSCAARLCATRRCGARRARSSSERARGVIYKYATYYVERMWLYTPRAPRARC